MPKYTLNPKTGFSVLPQKGWTFTPKRVTSETGNTSLRRSRGKWTLGPKRPASCAPKRGPAAVIERYYDSGGTRIIEHVYARNYNRFVGTANLLAVKADGKRGWITVEGRFIGEEAFRNTLHSIDSTLVGAGAGLVEKWDSLRPSQKAAVVDEFRNFNWDEFWTQFYPRFTLSVNRKGQIVRKRRPGSETWESDVQYSMLDEIVERFARAIGE